MVEILNNLLYGISGATRWWTLPLIVALVHLSGTCNNLQDPGMGMKGYRFGRNLAPEWLDDDSRLLDPNPREISNKLLVRDKFKPAETLNLLAAAWVHFQVHDWMSHGRDVRGKDYIRIPLPDDDRWRPEVEEMRIPRTINDSRIDDDPKQHVAYGNEQTHWWDMSQVYGTVEEVNSKLRTYKDGKLFLDKEGLLPTDTDGMEVTGWKQNWWLGLSLLHTLFTKEHNAICDYLKLHHPEMNDQELYDKARLINTAVNAKVHTVEWTTAILSDEIGYIALNTNWYGFKQVFPEQKLLIDALNIAGILSSKSTFGIIGHPTNLNGVPFSLTEEFTAVYRFHSFLPDNLTVVDSANGKSLGEAYSLADITMDKATKMMHQYKFKDLLASFGTSYAGALVLNNFPMDLTDLTLPYDHPKVRMDLAAVDVLRDRERGVPRINDIRRGLNLPAFKSFEDMNPDPETVNQLKNVYKTVEDVDCLIGMMAEMPRPPGWAFGDTTFTVFVTMASRRLLTDRFLTDDFTPEYYTQEGIDWVTKAQFRDILLRHEPELEDLLDTVSNPFAPWSFR